MMLQHPEFSFDPHNGRDLFKLLFVACGTWHILNTKHAHVDLTARVAAQRTHV